MTGSSNHPLHRIALSLAFTASILCSAAPAQKPAPTISPGCGALKGTTTCNWPAFRHVLHAAHVIAVEHEKMDRFTGRQLADLAERLGKTVASPDHPGDLTFVIIPAEEHGVDIGTAEQPVLKLQIYAGPTSAGKPLWVETLLGDPERPWPSNVHAVIDQFEARLAKQP